MNTKEIIEQLKAIHGKQYKEIFTNKLHARWSSQHGKEWTEMIRFIIIDMGLNLDQLNSNTANSLAHKLDLK
jgi:hypothetical protein